MTTNTKNNNSKKMKRIPLDVLKEKRDAFKAWCSERGLTMADVLRPVVEDKANEYLAEKQS